MYITSHDDHISRGIEYFRENFYAFCKQEREVNTQSTRSPEKYMFLILGVAGCAQFKNRVHI